MESFGGKNENPITSDIGFQPEIIPEGVSASELVDFFIEHLSASQPEGISEQYHNIELAYYRQQAFEAMSVMDDERERERLRGFLNSH